MFKFNFSNPEENEKEDTAAKESTISQDEDVNCLEWFPAQEVFITSKELTNVQTCSFNCGQYKLRYINPKEISDVVKDENILEAELQHSDLIPAKYEGGMKIWECTSDLADYLTHHDIHFDGKRVLDLGCGAGLLGILASHLGALSVHFQDYNMSVITSLTIPNFLLNTRPEQNKIPSSTRFFAGDWNSFVELTKEESCERYDCILTSETIYNPDNYTKLLNVFNNSLAPQGVIYLAAKTCYFGVGGGMREFENFLIENGNFLTQICWKHKKGVQREILKITFQHKEEIADTN